MARPDKAERARRQQLAAGRRGQGELDHDRAEQLEQQRAAVEEDRWQAEYERHEEARAADAYADRAVKALDDLAALVVESEGGDVPAEDVREILRTAGHRDYLWERGWCGTGE